MIGHLLQADVEELVRARRWDELRAAFEELPAADIAEIVEDMLDIPGPDEAILFRLLPRDQAAEVFAYLPMHRQRELVLLLSGPNCKSLLDEMPPDDRTRLLEELPAEVTKRLLNELSPEDLKQARNLLGYPERTAGRYMTPEYVALGPEMTAAEALEHVRKTGRGKETLGVLYVVDAAGLLLEDLRLGALVLADPPVRVNTIEDRPLVSILATLPIEEVITAFQRHGRIALPVVDAQGRMLGIITQDDVLALAQEEATEDIQRLGGSETLDAPYLRTSFWSMVRKRGGWLSALFLGEMLTATAMGYFEGEIERAAIVALFVPLIISSGGNSGSQATTLIIRSLALREMRLRDWYRVFIKEIASGMALGFFLGIIGFMRIIAWYKLGLNDYKGHPVAMGFTVWVSLIGVVTFGSLAGAMLPFILRKLGFDPATASAPFVATLVDVTGLCIYFVVAMLMLRGSLLAPPPKPHSPAGHTQILREGYRSRKTWAPFRSQMAPSGWRPSDWA
jgi:magnesium transporter